MFKIKFPRLRELKALAPSEDQSFFRNFDQDLKEIPDAREYYQRLENALQQLDDNAWTHIKKEARSRLTARQSNGRGWEQLLDIMSEVWAFNYFFYIGCSNIQFIPRTTVQTPDLQGLLGEKRILCEVKTINISDEEADFRSGLLGIRKGQIVLPEGFFMKLREKIQNANSQFNAYDPCGEASRFIYFFIWFDDILAELKERYFQQIDEWVDKHLTEPIEKVPKLVFCNDKTVFYKPLQMKCADVHNIG
jgi:hypothetical protein